MTAAHVKQCSLDTPSWNLTDAMLPGISTLSQTARLQTFAARYAANPPTNESPNEDPEENGDEQLKVQAQQRQLKAVD